MNRPQRVNRRPVEGVLSRLLEVKPEEFQLAREGQTPDPAGRKALGLDIENAKTFLPEVVHIEPPSPVDVQEFGITEPSEWVDPERLLIVAVAGLQELSARLDALEARGGPPAPGE